MTAVDEAARRLGTDTRAHWLQRGVSLGLDGLDALFDAVNSLLRVLIRGRFQPDARSYRGSRFQALRPADVLVQQTILNAEDEIQARKIVALEPDRYLALDPSLAVFDLAGPLASSASPQEREDGDDEGYLPAATEPPTPTYLVGLVQKARLEALRANAPKRLLGGGVEAFVFSPPEAPDLALVFREEPENRRRRLRRALVAVVLPALIWSAWDAWSAWSVRLAARAEAAEAEELALQRRIRLAGLRVVEARRAEADLAANGAPPLKLAVDRLATLAARLPADAELNEVNWTPQRIDITGRAWRPLAVELELRRGFEDSRIDFFGPGGAPLSDQPARGGGQPTAATPFQGAITWPEPSGPSAATVAAGDNGSTASPVSAMPR